MASKKIDLNANGQAVNSAAAQIYAAYVAQGKVPEGAEEKWLERAIKDAVRIARTVTKVIERDSSGIASSGSPSSAKSSGAEKAKTNSQAAKPAADAKPAPAAVDVEVADDEDDAGFELEFDDDSAKKPEAGKVDGDEELDDLLSLMEDELED